MEDPKSVVPDKIKVKKMPDTGGPPLIVVGLLELLSAALVSGGAILRP